MYEGLACIHICVPHLCLIPTRSEEGVRSPGSRVVHGVSHHVDVS